MDQSSGKELPTLDDATSILESITDAFFSLNGNWEFTYVNRQTEKLLGRVANELLGKSLWDAYPGVAGSEFETMYRRAAVERITVTFTAYYPDHDRWYEVHAYPARDGLSVYFRDATQRIRTERKLRDSDTRFRLMADSIPQIVWITDAAGNTEFFNRQWTLYTGAPFDPTTATDISLKFVHPDDHVLTMQTWAEAHRQGKTFIVEHRIRSSTGQYRWFLVRAEPYRDPGSGEIVRWFGTSTDVHENRMAEAARRRSEAQYRTLFNSIDEGFCIIDMIFDDSGKPVDYRFCEVNTMFELQTGLVDAVGKTVRELVPQHEAHWFELYGKVAQTGEPVRFENEAKGLQRWYDVYAFRADEAYAGKVAILFKDITERRRNEYELAQKVHELEAERARLQAIVDTIPTGLIMLDENGAMVLENAEWKRTWAGNALVNSVVDYDSYKGFRPDTGERISAEEWPCAISLKEGIRTRDVILDIERFNGTRATIVVSSAPIHDTTGRIVGAVAANMDITELRAAQAQLLDADRRKDEFLAMLSHELRNPLAPIQNSLHILDRADPAGQQARNAREIIGRQVTHLTKLVDDLLDVTRIAKGKIELQRAKLDIAALVRRTAEDYRALTQGRGLELVVTVADEALIVEGDETRLAQVLGNLLTNAAKFTPLGGRITLTAHADGECAIVCVRDNGIGIAPDLLPTIFDPFTQANQNLARTEGGLGLGLALVKGVVELHSGRVTVASTPGAGTAFTVKLPLAKATESTSDDFAASTNDRGIRPYRVLVVDDNTDYADTLAALVGMFGHAVEVAYDGRSAVALAEAKQHDLILCDIGLPGMDGYEVAQALRRKLPSKTRLIAVSGYAQPEDVRKSLDAGFNEHFAKPLDTQRIKLLFEGND